MKELRRYPRLPVSLITLVETTSGARLTGRLTNISACGAGLIYPADVSTGEVMRLRFTVEDGGDRLRNVHVKSVVRHFHARDDGYYLGMEFIEQREHEFDTLADYIADQVRRPAA